MPYKWESSPRECEHCEETFTPMRSDARYCSTKCRVAAHRADQRFARERDKLAQSINNFIDEYYGAMLAEETIASFRALAGQLNAMATEGESRRQDHENGIRRLMGMPSKEIKKAGEGHNAVSHQLN